MNAFQRFAARLFFGVNSTYENANRSPRRAQVPGSAPRDATLDLTPGVYLAGRRYDTLLRDLIPFGYFEDSCSAAGKEFGNAKDLKFVLEVR